MKQKSKWLFVILLLFIFFISVRIYIYSNLYSKIEYDAKAINELGLIRGSIQRLVKLRLHGEEGNELANNIDNLLNYYIEDDNALKDDIYLKTVKLPELKSHWDQLKTLLHDYRINPFEVTSMQLIEKSEECWEISNIIVLRSQHQSEKKILGIRFLTVSFAFDLFIIFVLSFISKKYVRDNLEITVLYDPLTKAYNRRYFAEAMAQEMERVYRNKKTFSLIMLDIDHFKKVNDTYGHDVGDYVLKEIVSVVKNNIRKYDIVSRIGGEEFTVILPDTEIDYASTLAERLRKAIECHKFGYVKRVTVSLGVAQYEDKDTLDTIMKRVDEALYMAKNNGRNRYEIVVTKIAEGLI